MAVDYVKTGVPAEFPKRLDPKPWPHFMEKAKRSYHSTTALGKLYDMVKQETFDMNANYKLPFDNRILKHTKCRALRDETLTKARRIKSQYDTAMRRVMAQLEIGTEFEVWTSFVLSKPRVGSDYKLQENVGRESSALKLRFKEQCKIAAGSDLLSFVAAMYRVTCEEVRIALHEAQQPHIKPDGSVGTRKISPKTMPLVSFPWLFWDKLGELARTGAILQRKLDDGSEDMDLLSDVPLVSHRRRGRTSSADYMDEGGNALPPYTQTSDGRVFHYGEILNLFSHEDEDEDRMSDVKNGNDSIEESTPVESTPVDSSKSASKLDTVAEEDLLSFEEPPARTFVKRATPEFDLLSGPMPTLTKAELEFGLSGPVAKTYTPPLTDEETSIPFGNSKRTSHLSTSTSSDDSQPPTEQASRKIVDLLTDDIYDASPPRARAGGSGESSTTEENVVVRPPDPPIWVEKVMRMGHRIPTPPFDTLFMAPNVVSVPQSEFDSPRNVTASAIDDPFTSPSPAVATPATGGGGGGSVNNGLMMGFGGGVEKEEDDEDDEEVEEVELEMDKDRLADRFEKMAGLV